MVDSLTPLPDRQVQELNVRRNLEKNRSDELDQIYEDRFQNQLKEEKLHIKIASPNAEGDTMKNILVSPTPQLASKHIENVYDKAGSLV